MHESRPDWEKGERARCPLLWAWRHIQRTYEPCRELEKCGGISPAAGAAPHFPIPLGEADKAVLFAERCRAQGLFPSAIQPPTMPRGTSRLRLTVAAAHTEGAIDRTARPYSHLAGGGVNPPLAPGRGCAIIHVTGSCGRSSSVERQLPKLNVEGSIPFARSTGILGMRVPFLHAKNPGGAGECWVLGHSSAQFSMERWGTR